MPRGPPLNRCPLRTGPYGQGRQAPPLEGRQAPVQQQRQVPVQRGRQAESSMQTEGWIDPEPEAYDIIRDMSGKLYHAQETILQMKKDAQTCDIDRNTLSERVAMLSTEILNLNTATAVEKAENVQVLAKVTTELEETKKRLDEKEEFVTVLSANLQTANALLSIHREEIEKPDDIPLPPRATEEEQEGLRHRLMETVERQELVEVMLINKVKEVRVPPSVTDTTAINETEAEDREDGMDTDRTMKKLLAKATSAEAIIIQLKTRISELENPVPRFNPHLTFKRSPYERAILAQTAWNNCRLKPSLEFLIFPNEVNHPYEQRMDIEYYGVEHGDLSCHHGKMDSFFEKVSLPHKKKDKSIVSYILSKIGAKTIADGVDNIMFTWTVGSTIHQLPFTLLSVWDFLDIRTKEVGGLYLTEVILVYKDAAVFIKVEAEEVTPKTAEKLNPKTANITSNP